MPFDSEVIFTENNIDGKDGVVINMNREDTLCKRVQQKIARPLPRPFGMTAHKQPTLSGTAVSKSKRIDCPDPTCWNPRLHFAADFHAAPVQQEDDAVSSVLIENGWAAHIRRLSRDFTESSCESSQDWLLTLGLTSYRSKDGVVFWQCKV